MMHIAAPRLDDGQRLEQRACFAFADIEYEGLTLDTKAWLQLASDSSSKDSTEHSES